MSTQAAPAPAPASAVKPSLWQCLPCPKCGQKSYATPWEPQAVCQACVERTGARVELQVVEVYLPFGR